MNPPDLRMMWMSQYPERISFEDAANYFGHNMGLSVIDDMNQQTTLNPMMSLVGGDFNAQAAAVAASNAAAAAALNVPAGTLIATTNTNELLAQMSLQQQILQQSAATGAVYQPYADMMDADAGDNMVAHKALHEQFGIDDGSLEQQQQHQLAYDQMDDAYNDLTPKQEIINIDDFVMMTDSNSYDGTDFISDKDTNNSLDENDLLMSMHVNAKLNELDDEHTQLVGSSDIGSGAGVGGGGGGKRAHHSGASTSANAAAAANQRSQRKTRKIEPVKRPGLVLKTPIAYKGNIDPSIIPIQKDGMGVCELCGAIGVKHTFYGKSRRFCSVLCSREELQSLVVNTKMSTTNENAAEDAGDAAAASTNAEHSQSTAADLETAMRAAHIKNHNQQYAQYRFKISAADTHGIKKDVDEHASTSNDSNANSNSMLEDETHELDEKSVFGVKHAKMLQMYRDVMPCEDLPQIPKLDRLPTPCPQMEKVISVRRRMYDPNNSYDWRVHLKRDNFYAAPVTCFQHAPAYDVWHSLDIDMKVEVENTDCDSQEVIQPGQTPHSFWVASILKICGYKAQLRYEGFDRPSHDFWVNLCNAEVHAVGWCATRGKPLIPPRTIQNKYKDWKDFLVNRLSGARTLPTNFYNKINDSLPSRFRLGLNLECVDKDRISQVRLATVSKIVGKRLFLRYFDSDDGFWCHEDSPIIHPVGWATTVGHNLAAPQDYLERMLAGREAMIEVHEDDATIELFKMNFTFEEYYIDGKTNHFVEGMKLEAVDPLNLSSICAATVMAVLKFGYMMIRIDSYQPDVSGSDWFCYHEKSPNIFPVGFCAANNITLTPPNGFDVKTFTWETYLKQTGSMAAGTQLFHRVVPDHGFKVGMSLECADLMDPRLVCVATVSRVVGRLIKVHFDGWTDEYDQWLDCESPDFYPVGWCLLVNHKLEGPPAQQQPAPKPVPKTKTNKKRKKKASGGVKTMPAATAAVATGTDAGAGAASHKQQQQANKDSAATANKARTTIPLKTNPHLPKLSIKLELKPEHDNPAFYAQHDDDLEDEDDDDDDNDDDDEDNYAEHDADNAETSVRKQSPKQQPFKISTGGKASSKAMTGGGKAAATNKQQSQAHATRSAVTATNSSVSSSKYIPRLSDANNDGSTEQCSNQQQQQQHSLAELMPETWNVYDVSQFLRVNGCTAHCDTLSRNKIDGKRLLQLSRDDIVNILGMKVGPAVKIYDLIQQLKCKINPGKSRITKGGNKNML